MSSTEYTGKVSGMKTSPWMASEDLLGVGSVKLAIAGIFQNDDVAMDAGRIEKRLFSIAFEKTPKQMILNATNRRTLSAAFGADTKQWIGQTVEVYVEDGIRKPGKGGGTTTGLRIRATPNPELAKARRAQMTGGDQ